MNKGIFFDEEDRPGEYYRFHEESVDTDQTIELIKELGIRTFWNLTLPEEEKPPRVDASAYILECANENTQWLVMANSTEPKLKELFTKLENRQNQRVDLTR